MYLRNITTKERIFAGIDPLSPKELKSIAKNKEFKFKWSEEKINEIYKLYRLDTGEILGLMSLINVPEAMAIEIKLLETGKTNVGSGKYIDRIAGCLIAWACKLSFSRGYDGWIKVIAKNNLIEYYKKQYKMTQIGKMQTLQIEQKAAIFLIAEYLSD